MCARSDRLPGLPFPVRPLLPHRPYAPVPPHPPPHPALSGHRVAPAHLHPHLGAPLAPHSADDVPWALVVDLLRRLCSYSQSRPPEAPEASTRAIRLGQGGVGRVLSVAVSVPGGPPGPPPVPLRHRLGPGVSAPTHPHPRRAPDTGCLEAGIVRARASGVSTGGAVGDAERRRDPVCLVDRCQRSLGSYWRGMDLRFVFGVLRPERLLGL